MANETQTPNGELFIGAWVTWTYRDSRGVLRTLTGVVADMNPAGDVLAVRCDGGQIGYRAGEFITLTPGDVELSASPFAPKR